MASPGDQERIARHLAFWELQEVDRPLIGVNVSMADSGADALIYHVAKEGDVLQPGQWHSLNVVERMEEHWQTLESVEVDLFRPAASLLSGLEMEACLGVPLRVMSGSVWPERVLGEDEPLSNLRITISDEWLQALLDDIDNLARWCGDRYPLMAPRLRAPADVLTATIGTTRACAEFYDHPDEMSAIIDAMADAWCRAAPVLQSHVPLFHGGFVLSAANGIYAPAPAACTSEDSTTFLSNAMFKSFLLPADIRISQTFPFGFIHRHSASQQSIASLSELSPNWVVQVCMDQMGPPIDEILPVFHALQSAGRPLIVQVFAQYAREQIAAMARELSPRGLCVIVDADTVPEAQDLSRMARDAWRAG